MLIKAVFVLMCLLLVACSSASQQIIPTLTPTELPPIPSIQPSPAARYSLQTYTAKTGDTLFSIAHEFRLEPESILFSNFETMMLDPHTIRAGMELLIPPDDGAVHTWSRQDTVESVASEYQVDPDAILGWPGNAQYLKEDEIEVPSGTKVFIPGGRMPPPTWKDPEITRGKDPS